MSVGVQNFPTWESGCGNRFPKGDIDLHEANPRDAQCHNNGAINMRATISRLSLLVVLSLFLSLLVHAQDAASLTGTVQDKTGAVIPNARVTIQSAVTGFVRN